MPPVGSEAHGRRRYSPIQRYAVAEATQAEGSSAMTVAGNDEGNTTGSFQMSGTTISAGKRAATLGEHAVSLLRQSGLSQDQIAALVGKLPLVERC